MGWRGKAEKISAMERIICNLCMSGSARVSSFIIRCMNCPAESDRCQSTWVERSTASDGVRYFIHHIAAPYTSSGAGGGVPVLLICEYDKLQVFLGFGYPMTNYAGRIPVGVKTLPDIVCSVYERKQVGYSKRAIIHLYLKLLIFARVLGKFLIEGN